MDYYVGATYEDLDLFYISNSGVTPVSEGIPFSENGFFTNVIHQTHYVQIMRGAFSPPEDGDYRFLISSKDSS